jgi:uncharacterized protein YndB with AHSA1/START domain
MLKTIVIVLLVLIVVPLVIILGLAMTKPDTFRVQRSAGINAPPERIFPLISDFDRWTAWSPYEKLDPDLKRTRSGAPRGKGAVYEWEGNNKVGKGRMEIIDESPPNRVLIKLDFFKPFEAHNTAEFTLQPAGETTNVTWAMTGPNLFIGRVMSVFINMDRMVGKDFETGLANLKAIAESDTAKP